MDIDFKYIFEKEKKFFIEELEKNKSQLNFIETMENLYKNDNLPILGTSFRKTLHESLENLKVAQYNDYWAITTQLEYFNKYESVRLLYQKLVDIELIPYKYLKFSKSNSESIYLYIKNFKIRFSNHYNYNINYDLDFEIEFDVDEVFAEILNKLQELKIINNALNWSQCISYKGDEHLLETIGAKQ